MTRRFSILDRSNGGGKRGGLRLWYVLPVAGVFWITLLAQYHRPPYIPITTTITITTTTTAITTTNNNNNKEDGLAAVTAASRAPPPTVQPPSVDPCDGRYVYMHDLPRRFNTDMLRDCRALSTWTNMCRFTSNAGLGPPLGKSGGVFSGSGSWYATNQFALEVIFYNSMKHYACLTRDSSRAAAVFVPFFAGLDVARYLWGGHNMSSRDSASLDLVRWLRSRPEWGVMGGRDHFLVAGRIAWDFRWLTESNSDWGNKLLVLPEARNMSVLVLESSPWDGNNFAIPYPTYFHPAKDAQLLAWQKRVRRAKRPWLFSFAGAPRPNQAKSIRGRIIEQCQSSRRCSFLDCGSGARNCHSPGNVMRAFQSATFCLQPQGDSYTRRSAFDAMVAGCVPVFFHPGTAYVQYLWHLPRNHSSYSVFIPEDEMREGKVSIEERLAGIPEREVRTMREEVIKMIPRLVYTDPRASRVTAKDAFEVAVEGVIQRVDQLRREMRGEGVAAPPINRTDEEHHHTWKYALVGNAEPHEWDRFFSRTSH